MGKKLAYFTICARNYLAYALTLRSSLWSVNPNADFYIFLADAPLEADTKIDGHIVALDQIDLPNAPLMKFRYNVLELATAIKPFCFLHLMEKAGYDAAIYLDPDIQVFARLTDVENALQDGVSCVLTPHILQPLKDDFHPSDLDILISGTFNLGFAAFSKLPEAIEFIRWWGNKLESNCFVDVANGLFVDQKFVDFAPSFIKNLKILRHLGYNVAYWNLAHRALTRVDTELMVENEPLVFFHFSGIDARDDSVLSKHQNRFTPENHHEFSNLVKDYHHQLHQFGHDQWSRIPYAFSHFDTGEAVLDVFRRGPPLEASNPLKAPNLKYWLEPSEGIDGAMFTRFMMAVYEARQDLKSSFSLATESGRAGFVAWLSTNFSVACSRYETLITSDLRKKRINWLTRIWLAIGRRMGLI